jgi:hypothetical protein
MCEDVIHDEGLYMYEYSPDKTLERIFQDIVVQPPRIAARAKQALIDILQREDLKLEDVRNVLSKTVFLKKVYEGMDVVVPYEN